MNPRGSPVPVVPQPSPVPNWNRILNSPPFSNESNALILPFNEDFVPLALKEDLNDKEKEKLKILYKYTLLGQDKNYKHISHGFWDRRARQALQLISSKHDIVDLLEDSAEQSGDPNLKSKDEIIDVDKEYVEQTIKPPKSGECGSEILPVEGTTDKEAYPSKSIEQKHKPNGKNKKIHKRADSSQSDSEKQFKGRYFNEHHQFHSIVVAVGDQLQLIQAKPATVLFQQKVVPYYKACSYCLQDHLTGQCSQQPCFRCAEMGHIQQHCPLTQDKACHRCGKVGHKQMDCYAFVFPGRGRFYGAINWQSQTEASEQWLKQSSQSRKDDNKRVKCCYCGSYGHIQCWVYGRQNKSASIDVQANTKSQTNSKQLTNQRNDKQQNNTARLWSQTGNNKQFYERLENQKESGQGPNKKRPVDKERTRRNERLDDSFRNYGRKDAHSESYQRQQHAPSNQQWSYQQQQQEGKSRNGRNQQNRETGANFQRGNSSFTNRLNLRLSNPYLPPRQQQKVNLTDSEESYRVNETHNYQHGEYGVQQRERIGWKMAQRGFEDNFRAISNQFEQGRGGPSNRAPNELGQANDDSYESVDQEEGNLGFGGQGKPNAGNKKSRNQRRRRKRKGNLSAQSHGNSNLMVLRENEPRLKQRQAHIQMRSPSALDGYFASPREIDVDESYEKGRPKVSNKRSQPHGKFEFEGRMPTKRFERAIGVIHPHVNFEPDRRMDRGGPPDVIRPDNSWVRGQMRWEQVNNPLKVGQGHLESAGRAPERQPRAQEASSFRQQGNRAGRGSQRRRDRGERRRQQSTDRRSQAPNYERQMAPNSFGNYEIWPTAPQSHLFNAPALPVNGYQPRPQQNTSSKQMSVPNPLSELWDQQIDF